MVVGASMFIFLCLVKAVGSQRANHTSSPIFNAFRFISIRTATNDKEIDVQMV